MMPNAQQVWDDQVIALQTQVSTLRAFHQWSTEATAKDARDQACFSLQARERRQVVISEKGYQYLYQQHAAAAAASKEEEPHGIV
jgi:hypothetical protein